MEKINQVAVRAIENLQNCLPQNSESRNEISIYKGALTAKCLVDNVASIKKAFPGLPLSFYDVLTDRIRVNGFSDDRLRDAVAHVIDTCIYPLPTIAQFISYDKKVRTYSYTEYCKLIDAGEKGENYKPIKLKDLPAMVWIHINDIAEYHIQDDSSPISTK